MIPIQHEGKQDGSMQAVKDSAGDTMSKGVSGYLNMWSVSRVIELLTYSLHVGLNLPSHIWCKLSAYKLPMGRNRLPSSCFNTFRIKYIFSNALPKIILYWNCIFNKLLSMFLDAMIIVFLNMLPCTSSGGRMASSKFTIEHNVNIVAWPMLREVLDSVTLELQDRKYTPTFCEHKLCEGKSKDWMGSAWNWLLFVKGFVFQELCKLTNSRSINYHLFQELFSGIILVSFHSELVLCSIYILTWLYSNNRPI